MKKKLKETLLYIFNFSEDTSRIYLIGLMSISCSVFWLKYDPINSLTIMRVLMGLTLLYTLSFMGRKIIQIYN